MGKEVKIGLAVIGVLLCVFGGVLAMRLKREHPASALEKVAAAEKDGKIGGKKKAAVKRTKNEEADDKQDNASSSLNERLQGFAGRTKNEPKTDRYGRPLADENWSTPAESEPSDELADINQADPPDVSDSAYGKYVKGHDRDARYQDAAVRETAIEEGDSTLDDRGDENQADDLAMPADRFARPAGGVSFNDLEPVDDANTADPDEDMDQDGSAPRFSIAPREDRFASHGEPAGEEIDNLDADRENRGLVLAPVPDDESPDDENNVEPLAEDRFSRRDREQRLPSRGREIEETIDDTAEQADDRIVDSPRRLRQPDDDSYVVEPNDNFWRISQKVYGTGAYFKALEEHNRRQTGDRPLINVGDAISTPPLSILQQKYPDLCPKPRKLAGEGRGGVLASAPARGGRTYTVAEGDTLFDIARAELGKASRWAEIYELNRDQLGEDFNYLAPGMQLVMPSRSDRAESITTRPSRDAYRR